MNVNKLRLKIMIKIFLLITMFSYYVIGDDIDLYSFCDNELWGYIDKNGKIIIPPKFPRNANFVNGYAKVYDNLYDGENTTFINKKGEVILVLPKDYRTDGFFSNGIFKDGLLRVFSRGKRKYGFINIKGEIICPFKYDLAQDFSDGLALVYKGDMLVAKKTPSSFNWYKYPENAWTYINSKGDVTLQVKHNHAHSFYNGIAIVGNAYDTPHYRAIINKKGEILFKTTTLNLSHYNYLNEGLILLYKKNKVGAISSKGRYVIPMEYDYIIGISEGYAVVEKDDYLY